MSSPRRRIETDVMKMYVRRFSTGPGYTAADRARLMSDYEVTLINDNSRPPPARRFSVSPERASLTAMQCRSWRRSRPSSPTRSPVLTLAARQEFFVRFKGPAETPFEGGIWKVHVELPDSYPYKSPSIGFVNRIFHPNIDELSGSVCLDVINQTWSPMYDMINIFEVFLPQLLRYPNPTDPLNGEAAALLIREPKGYETKVKEYVQKYATKDAADEAGVESEEDDDMSSVASFSDGDEQPAGPMDDV